jgi:hypothetical protein
MRAGLVEPRLPDKPNIARWLTLSVGERPRRNRLRFSASPPPKRPGQGACRGARTAGIGEGIPTLPPGTKKPLAAFPGPGTGELAVHQAGGDCDAARFVLGAARFCVAASPTGRAGAADSETADRVTPNSRKRA